MRKPWSAFTGSFSNEISLPLLCLALVSCAPAYTKTERLDPMGDPLKIDPTKPPDGMQLVQILLENQSLPVKGTGCQSGSIENRRLQHILAMVLGYGLDGPVTR